MKKIILTLALAVAAICAYAQGQMDALRFYESDIMGTARYMGMGGAFNALGGDATAISKNPAGLGVYRKSELSITANVFVNKSQMETATSTNTSTRTNFNISNFALVGSFLNGNAERGLIASNFSITYDRLKSFHSNKNMATASTASSIVDQIYGGGFLTKDLSDAADELHLYNIFDDQGFEWLSNKMTLRERGSLGEWNFAYGANISNMLYLGAALGVRSLDYSMESSYSEDYYDLNNEHFGFLDLNNFWGTTATGFNLKIGAIVRPVDFLRIGASIQTPTWYSVTESFSANGVSFYQPVEGAPVEGRFDGPNWYNGLLDYNMSTPYIVNTGIAFVLGGKGIISADYEMKNYSLIDYDGLDFTDRNAWIGEDFHISHALRVGGEYRITDAFSARLGYAFTTSSVKVDDLPVVATGGTVTHYTIPKDNSYYTIGFGYRAEFFFMDFAFVYNIKKENFYAHNFADRVVCKSKIGNLAATFGWRF